MREYKFRGKSINSNEWFEGDLVKVNDNGRMRYFIITEEYEATASITENWFGVDLGTCQSPEVDSNTIGRYTEVEDKNDAEIYEGDIIRLEFGKKWRGKVEFDNGAYTINFGGASLYLCSIDLEKEPFVVIGNIYDNPELLKESE